MSELLELSRAVELPSPEEMRLATRQVLGRITIAEQRVHAPDDDAVIDLTCRGATGTRVVRSFEHGPEFRASPIGLPETDCGRQSFAVFAPEALDDTSGDRRGAIDAALRAGMNVRIAELPYRLIIVDRSAAFMTADFNDPAAGFIYLKDPDVINGLTELFAKIFRRGQRVERREASPTGRLSTELVDVLEQLLSGAPDDRACRRLGISLRTYRRRVSEVMECLGASNRFAAGAAAAELGYVALLREPPLQS